MPGGQEHIKRGSRQRTQERGLEPPQAAAQPLGYWLKMQEPGLHLRPGELVPGVGAGSPHSNRHCSSQECWGGPLGREEEAACRTGSPGGMSVLLIDSTLGFGRPRGVLFLDVSLPGLLKGTLNREAVV